MSKRISVSAAQYIADCHNLKQVILLAWDGRETHIVTYGQSVDDCSQAADGGNMLKEKWGWPECNDQPSRVRKLEGRISELELELALLQQQEPASKAWERGFQDAWKAAATITDSIIAPCDDPTPYAPPEKETGV